MDIKPSIVKMIGNREKAHQEAFDRIMLANDERIMELEVKRDYHLKMAEEHDKKRDEHNKKRDEIYEELARRGFTFE
jgi:hypothetical protein